MVATYHTLFEEYLHHYVPLLLRKITGGDGNAFRRRHGFRLGQPLLLFVGRAAHEKNIGFLLEMLLELRQRICRELGVD